VDIIKTPNEYIDKKYVNMNGICKNSATLFKDNLQIMSTEEEVQAKGKGNKLI
jgi:hypothetical protein